MAVLMRANNTVEYVRPANRRTFTLTELQGFVGGYIEAIRLPPEFPDDMCFLILNEDGKGLRLPFNRLGTFGLHMAGGAPDDFVVGDVVLCTATEIGQDDDTDDTTNGHKSPGQAG